MQLDSTAIIATAPTAELKDALRSDDPKAVERAMKEWEPVIDIPIDDTSLHETIAEFGSAIDKIETRKFPPPPLKKLTSHVSRVRKIAFATDVCRNCDARFSCASYRRYAEGHQPKV